MKKVVCLLFFGLLISSSVCNAAGNELRFLPYHIIPGDDAWDSAIGIEVQYVIWSQTNFGFVLAGGIGSWKIDEDILIDYDLGLAVGIDGSAKTFPLGASVLLRPFEGVTADITFEGGLRYVFVDSNIDAWVSDGYDSLKATVDINNGLIGLIAGNVAYPISPKMNLGFGVGYQFDISKGSVKWYGADLGDNAMKGFFLRLGLNLKI